MTDLDLEHIAGILEGLEETIIQKLIDRIQFRYNPDVYRAGKSGFPDEPVSSLFELRLRYQEEMDSVFGRFLLPEERPFHADLPPARRSLASEPSPLRIRDYSIANLSPAIKDRYLALLPLICEAGDDGQYGSSSEHDVYAFQAIARRVHFGTFFVAECKYRSAPDLFRKLVETGDREGIAKALTRPEVEKAVIERVGLKVEKLQTTVRGRIRRSLPPEPVSAFYRETIIPLTKEGEVLYILRRAIMD